MAGFMDASVSAMCAIIYTETGVETGILLSKVRVTPLHGGSVPRHKLQAMVILLRIAILAARAVSFKAKRITLSTN